MKCTIPEISWHNRDPVLSIDIQFNKGNDAFYRVATGGTDSHVLMWILSVAKEGVASLECSADLKRHTKPVNCVRFSPSGEILASGDDDSCVILWKMKETHVQDDPPEIFNSEEESFKERPFKEQWKSIKVLRGHLQDIYDMSWSADSKKLITGSVDNTAILWDVHSGRNLGFLTEHKGFVQGVAWDPCGQYVATMSSDRVCRVYNAVTRKVVSKMYKGYLPGRVQELETKPAHYFHDDTLKSFFRRLTFSPDGQLLIVPSGIVEEPDKKPTHSTMIFHRNCLQKPIVYLPSLSQYSMAIRCCPVYFTLREMESPPLFQLPYRMVIAVATESDVILYDTQHAAPFAFITNMHYARLTDLSWSSDGRVLVVSSTDGYCSVITFAENELGMIYTGDSTQPPDQTPKKTMAMEDHLLKTPKQKNGVAFSLSEDANMPFEESGKKDGTIKDVPVLVPNPPSEKTKNIADDEKIKSTLSEKKDTTMDVDDFSLMYEGSVAEPILESKNLGLAEELKKRENKPIERSTTDSKNASKNSEGETADSDKSSEDLLNNRAIDQHSKNDLKLIEKAKKEESPKKVSKPTTSMQEEALTSPKSGVNITPGSNKKTPRRVQLITLSSPKSKKKLLE